LCKFNILRNVTQGWEGNINMDLKKKNWLETTGWFVWLRVGAGDELM